MDATTMIETLKSGVEYAPKTATTNPGLRGVWAKAEDGNLFLCAACLARLIARGCAPRPVEMVWKDRAEPFGVCVVCEF